MQSKATVDVSEYKNEVFGYSLQYPSTCTFGPMPKYCKQSPPEERPQECLCHLNAEDPNRVTMQSFQGDIEQGLTFAEFSISSYETSYFTPPPSMELALWLQENYAERYNDIPDEPNTEIGGIPAIEIYSPGSSMAPSLREIYFIRENRLFTVSMIYVEEESNKALYDLILSSISFD
jgi:hypothetical protein